MTPSQSYMTALYLGRASLICLPVQAVHVLIPLHGKQVFLPVVAFLAAGDQVVPYAFAPPGDRDYVIHGQLSWRKALSAVMTDPLCDPVAPPAGLPDLSCLVLLLLGRLFGYVGNEVVHRKSQLFERSSTMAALASSSHLSFSGCPECPFIHRHSTECTFERESSRSQRSRFMTGSFL